MCGISGISYPPQIAFDSRLLQESLRALTHRGPDDSGIYEDRDAGLGLAHARLSIQDVSSLGHQPMHSSNGEVILVFNGEIYNFRELRQSLELKGVSFQGQSDTEVVLNLYLVEGEKMLSRMNGIFALAVWDRRKGTLLIARDGLGVKPLYYSSVDGKFSFASEIKSLLKLAPKKHELDLEAIHRYLSYLWCPGEGTPLKAVRKLLPGYAIQVRAGEIVRSWCWYQLPIFQTSKIILAEHESISGVKDHLAQAVRRQMVADVPVGAFLSGGLDSSAIVAMACETHPKIPCFTIESLGGPEKGMKDDLPYARKVAKHLGVPLEVVTIDANRMADDLEKMVAQLDEPLADPASLNVLYISQLARNQGIKVLLSGAGGDDLFTGYRRHRAVQAESLWSWLPKDVRHGLAYTTGKLNQQRNLGRRVRKLFSGAALEGDERLVEYFKWIKETELRALYSTETRQKLSSVMAARPMMDFLKPLSKDIKPLERMLALEQRFFLTDHNLNYTDKMSMAAGVEVRVPFLDLDLVDFASQVPLALKQRGGEGKWVLKKAMESYLPKDVIYRPKSGFGAPIRRWMRHELRDLLHDLLSSESLTRRGLFEPGAVLKLIEANDAGRIDANYTLLAMLCIEIWCRTYLDSPSAN
ncbi:asparagine synthase (glutamine-hydrolyzing) [Desulfosediminicola sp.]|uniref:asparagine synthase (glutamine-hydrolyzing) n=1 Tax=Desulfosediminicola sp. TaxID=2886825 RepID=UPI003AF215A1